MRIAAQVFLGYALVLVFTSALHLLPLGRGMPDVVALMAMYLGLTARQRLAPATLGAVLIGYLADLLVGTPPGLLSFVAGVTCITGRGIHRGLIVRGWRVTIGISFSAGLFAGILTLMIRMSEGLTPGGAELGVLLWSAFLTGLLGPFVFRLCRMVDARFARTYREREAAIEGIAR